MDILERMEYRAAKENINPEEKKKILKKRYSITAIIAVCIIMLIIGLSYVAGSETIYFWDNSTYWDICRNILDGKLGVDLWQKIFESIGTRDYNYVAALPSTGWMMIFGKSREAYVSGLIVMYLIPSVLLTYRLSRKLSKAPMFSFAAAVFAMPALMYITFLGFVDVGGVMLALIILNLYYGRDNKSDEFWRYPIIGCLLVLIMIFRRYYAFFAVSFLTAMAADCILFRRRWRNLVTVLIVSGGLLATVFHTFLVDVLLKDYGSLYSGYKYSIDTDMKLFGRYFGTIFIILMLAVPLISGIKRKDFRPVFPWIQIVVCASMFMATQTHGQQHLLLYVPSFILLMIFAVNCISSHSALIAVSVLTAANFLSVFIPRSQPNNIQEIKHLSAVPTFNIKSVKRDDAAQIFQLKRDIDSLVPNGATCGVLASSFWLNDAVLRNVEPSLNEPVLRDSTYIFGLPEVDSRDYYRLQEIYTTPYLLTVIPSQTHLAPGEQTIVDEAVTSFVMNTDIAQIFEQISAWSIDGKEVRLYQRVNDIDSIRQREYEARLFY